jgi:hypothetical protein
VHSGLGLGRGRFHTLILSQAHVWSGHPLPQAQGRLYRDVGVRGSLAFWVLDACRDDLAGSGH